MTDSAMSTEILATLRNNRAPISREIVNQCFSIDPVFTGKSPRAHPYLSFSQWRTLYAEYDVVVPYMLTTLSIYLIDFKIENWTDERFTDMYRYLVPLWRKRYAMRAINLGIRDWRSIIVQTEEEAKAAIRVYPRYFSQLPTHFRTKRICEYYASCWTVNLEVYQHYAALTMFETGKADATPIYLIQARLFSQRDNIRDQAYRLIIASNQTFVNAQRDDLVDMDVPLDVFVFNETRLSVKFVLAYAKQLGEDALRAQVSEPTIKGEKLLKLLRAVYMIRAHCEDVDEIISLFTRIGIHPELNHVLIKPMDFGLDGKYTPEPVSDTVAPFVGYLKTYFPGLLRYVCTN